MGTNTRRFSSAQSPRRIPMTVPFPDLEAIAAQVKRAEQNLIFIHGIAEFLGVSQDVIRKYVERRKIPFTRSIDPRNGRPGIGLTMENTKRLMQMRADEGYPMPGGKK